MDEKLSAELKLALRRVEEEAAGAVYPDYRRGIRWGLRVLVLAVLPVPLLLILSGGAGTWREWAAEAGGALFFGVIFFAFGAFRPPKAWRK